MKALIRQAQKDYKGKVTKEGDKYTIDAEFAGKTDLQTFQLGVPFVSTALGPEEKTTFTLEGDVLKGVHEIGGKTALSKRYIKDGLLVILPNMEQFLGKWKMVPELTEGLEEYFEAMKIPEALRDTMRKYSNMTAEMTKEGDGYVSVIDHGDRKETIRFQLGVPVTTNSHGMDITSLLRLEGDRLLSEETVDGKKSCSTRYIQGDKLITETEGNGSDS
nr:hypothetical protein BaRGS_011484 [Batillaria attramentaria]